MNLREVDIIDLWYPKFKDFRETPEKSKTK